MIAIQKHNMIKRAEAAINGLNAQILMLRLTTNPQEYIISLSDYIDCWLSVIEDLETMQGIQNEDPAYRFYSYETVLDHLQYKIKTYYSSDSVEDALNKESERFKQLINTVTNKLNG